MQDVVDTAAWRRISRRDARLIEDEKAFKRTYRFAVGRSERGKVIELQRKADLTNFEVTLLWWSDSLDLRGVTAYISAYRWAQLWGTTLVGFLALLLVTAFLGGLRHPSPSGAVIAASCAIQFGLVGLMWLAHAVYVRPYALRRRYERSTSQTSS